MENDDSKPPTVEAGHAFSVGDAFVTLCTQLRAIARARLANNPALATLHATPLVNEALVRLLRRPPGTVADERHLLALASQAIRHVVVDHVRRKRARGGDHPGKMTADGGGDDSALASAVDRVTDPGRVELLLDLDAALDGLAAVDPELRTIVELHCYAGMGHDEVAAVLNLSERTVRRRWRYAAAPLRGRLSGWMEASTDVVDDPD